MTKLNLSDWIQIVGGFLILLGLILVLYELQQGRQIAGADLVSQQYDAISAHYDTMLGEASAEVLAKACSAPETLSPAEQRILNAYFNAQFVTVRRMRALAEQGDFTSSSLYWESWATGLLQINLGYPDGQHWWARTRRFYLSIYPDVVELGDELLKAQGDALNCDAFYKDWGRP